MEEQDSSEVELLHEGEIYKILLTPSQVQEISTDNNQFVHLIEQLKYEKENMVPASHMLQEVTPDLEASSSTSSSNESHHKWTHESIKLLINLRLAMEAQFNNPTCKKIKLWGIIAKKMCDIGKYLVSGNDCHGKYRNLLQTYRHNKEKKERTGEGKITWEYYDIFDEVLGSKASICPPKNILSSSIENKVDDKNNSTNIEGQFENIERETKKPRKRKNEEISLNQYLFMKCAKDEERQRERKQLKEMEIEAINNLADAIRSTVNKKQS